MKVSVFSLGFLRLDANTKTLEKKDGILTNLRFLLFSQRCILRNTADLLKFMLQSFPSIASVETVCCHNALPYRLRGDMTRGNFQLHIWRLNI